MNLTTASFVFQWLMLTLICAVLATSFIYFGFKLERAAYFYAKGQSQETLKALYTSVDWASVVEAKDRKLRAAEMKLEKVCKRNRKACI